MVGSSLNALPSSLDCILHSISVFLLWKQFAELCLLTTTMRIYSPVLKCGNSPFDDFPIKDIKASKKNRGFPIAHDGFEATFPSPPSRRLCGIVMSVCGAALATFFCGRFESHERPAARLLVNLAASLMAYTARATGMIRIDHNRSMKGKVLREAFFGVFSIGGNRLFWISEKLGV